MQPTLLIGIIIFTGFIMGEVSSQLRLPKITGYILAGLFLNPNLTQIIPETFVEHTNFVTNISLSFITFSVGGTLYMPKIRSLGKSILFITVFEAELAFLFVIGIVIFLGPVILTQPGLTLTNFFIPLALLMGALASPTDPSATLAVEHEYKAKGEVTSTIMGVAASDDIFGIVNFSVAGSIALMFLTHEHPGMDSVLIPIVRIAGSIISGITFGIILNALTSLINKESEGVLITLILGLLGLCYGIAGWIGIDELLSTMTMGIVVVNYNSKKEELFNLLERYTEELIFVLFFTISAMHLDFAVLRSNYILILLFIIFRSLGKLSGTVLGGKISGASPNIQKFTAGGLIPQGGIVIGLALLIKQDSNFSSISDILLNVIIGATIIHEILGPVISKYTLQKSGELNLNS